MTEASSSGSESSEKAVDTSNLSNERIVTNIAILAAKCRLLLLSI